MSKRNNKKGLSEVVSIILILALTVVLVGIIWGVINNFVKEGISQADSCLDTFGKVTLNNDYTCYNSSTNEVLFGINVGDITLERVLVGISIGETSVTFEIGNQVAIVNNLFNYPSRSAGTVLPGKNAGKTYIFSVGGAGLAGPVNSIRIAPTIGKNQCDISDSLEQIDNCLALIP